MLLTDDGYVSKWHRLGITFMDTTNNNNKKKTIAPPPGPVATAKAIKSTGSSTATGAVTGVSPVIRRPIPVKKPHMVAVGKANKLTAEEYERLRERERARIRELKKKAAEKAQLEERRRKEKAQLEERRRQEKIQLEEQRRRNEELERRLKRLKEIFAERRYKQSRIELRDFIRQNIGWIAIGTWWSLDWLLRESEESEPVNEDDFDPHAPNAIQKQTANLRVMIKQTGDHLSGKIEMDHPVIDFDAPKNQAIQEEFDEAERLGEPLKDKDGNQRERPPKNKKFSWTQENEIRRKRGW